MNWSEKVRNRDKVCLFCGEGRPDLLDAHHVLPKGSHPELEKDVRNGITVCRKCHQYIHSGRIPRELIEKKQRQVLNQEWALPKKPKKLNIHTEIYKVDISSGFFLGRVKEKINELYVGMDFFLHTKGKKRSLDQNSLYQLFCRFISKDPKMGGMTEESVHDGFKAVFLTKKIWKNGKCFPDTGSTTDLTKEEFVEYFAKCDVYIKEFGVNTEPFWVEYEKFRPNPDLMKGV